QPRRIVVVAGIAAVLAGWSVAFELFRSERLALSVVSQYRNDWYPEAAWPVLGAGSKCSVEEKWSGSDDVVRIESMSNHCSAEGGTSRRLFVVGDSHARAYRALLLHMAEEENLQVNLYLHTGCWFANLLESTPPNCKSFVSSSLDDIITKGKPHDV